MCGFYEVNRNTEHSNKAHEIKILTSNQSLGKPKDIINHLHIRKHKEQRTQTQSSAQQSHAHSSKSASMATSAVN